MNKIVKNHRVLLSVIEPSQLGSPVSNRSSKKIRSKINVSPFEDRILDKKGVPTGKYDTPKNLFLAPNNFQERSKQECYKSLTLSELSVNYFISEDACPYFINKKQWEKMNDVERLEVHLKLNSEGKEFNYEII